jgi:hypothetical protein
VASISVFGGVGSNRRKLKYTLIAAINRAIADSNTVTRFNFIFLVPAPMTDGAKLRLEGL